ncbi:MAG: ribosome biosis GTP-binding protein ysxc [Fibrobacteres bacterium]|nr:ribosome biosis GTP-binding protein ysxc [Fibrobacterota bacterium]
MQIKSAEFVKSAQHPDDYPNDGRPHIAVAGRSNVGKSSLLNMLVQRKNLVKTSQMPGKTRLINFFLINDAFYLVDIPGFGYAKVGREEKRQMEDAIETYFRKSGLVAGMMYLVDIRMPDSPVDKEAIQWLNDFGVPMLVVATKGDKLKTEQTRKALAEITKFHALPEPPLVTSADKKTGREAVLEQLAMVLESAASGSSGAKG